MKETLKLDFYFITFDLELEIEYKSPKKNG